MDRPPRFRTRALGIVAALACAAAVAWLLSVHLSHDGTEPTAARSGELLAAGRPQSPAPPAPPVAASPQALAPTPRAPQGAGSELPAEPDTAGLGGAWAVVDLEEVREAMPDNLYWRLSAPTHDQRVLREREEERTHWNEQYGKVLSGTGTEEEVRAYYAYRYRLSTDYVEFLNYVLDHHQRDLPDQDVGLLMLARRLHLARLEEVPRKLEEALARKRAQAAAREAWLAEQEAFEDPDADVQAPE